MDMEIKDVRIVDTLITPFCGMYEFALKLDMNDGLCYLTPNILITNEDIATICDVVGVKSADELKNTHIRIMVCNSTKMQMIGNATYDQWVDITRIDNMSFMWGHEDPPMEDKNITRKVENTMKTNYNAEYIKGFLKGQEDRLRQRRLDPDYIETLIEQSEYLIRSEMDPICLKYITLTFVEKISEHFYLGLNAKKYLTQTFEGIDVADIHMLRARAENAIGLVVVAGCTGDYPSITNQ